MVARDEKTGNRLFVMQTTGFFFFFSRSLASGNL
jgi:hypothetical protein